MGCGSSLNKIAAIRSEPSVFFVDIFYMRSKNIRDWTKLHVVLLKNTNEIVFVKNLEAYPSNNDIHVTITQDTELIDMEEDNKKFKIKISDNELILKALNSKTKNLWYDAIQKILNDFNQVLNDIPPQIDDQISAVNPIILPKSPEYSLSSVEQSEKSKNQNEAIQLENQENMDEPGISDNGKVCTRTSIPVDQAVKKCYTCNLAEEGKAICLVCARLCHSDHHLSELLYFNNFQCSCVTANCKALPAQSQEKDGNINDSVVELSEDNQDKSSKYCPETQIVISQCMAMGISEESIIKIVDQNKGSVINIDLVLNSLLNQKTQVPSNEEVSNKNIEKIKVDGQRIRSMSNVLAENKLSPEIRKQLMQNKQMQDKVDVLKEEEINLFQCKICHKHDISVVVMECGHLYACYDCASDLLTNKKKCLSPKCNKTVTKVIRVYF